MSDKEEKVEEKKDEAKKPFARKKSKKKSSLNLDKKLAQIEKSKLPKSEKKRYSAMLQDKAEKKKGVPFEVYASARNLKGGELAGKKALAKGRSFSLKEWDELFKKF